MRVDFLTSEQIASAANVILLLDCQDKTEQEIDVIGICQQHFGLSIHFVDLKSAYGENTLGMMLSNEKLILCDLSIEPFGERKEHKERILRFTIAHELGHHIFHQGYLDCETSPTFYNDLGDKEKDRIELQANIFASMLLMPEKLFRNMYQMLQTQDLKKSNLIKRLADMFNVSKEAAGYRVHAIEKEVVKEEA